jgi:hypothetical protein
VTHEGKAQTLTEVVEALLAMADMCRLAACCRELRAAAAPSRKSAEVLRARMCLVYQVQAQLPREKATHSPTLRQARHLALSLAPDGRARQFVDAARSNGVATLQQLLGEGIFVDVQDDRGLTALPEAARQGAREAVELLLHAGAERHRAEALDAAAVHGWPTVVQKLIAIGAEIAELDAALWKAVDRERDEVVQLLLVSGASANTTQPNRTTALMVAAEIGNAVIVELLLGEGANVNAKDANRKTAVDYVDRRCARAMQLIMAARGKRSLVSRLTMLCIGGRECRSL